MPGVEMYPIQTILDANNIIVIVYNIYVSHCMIPIIWKIIVLNLVIYPLNLHVELINIGRIKELQ